MYSHSHNSVRVSQLSSIDTEFFLVCFFSLRMPMCKIEVIVWLSSTKSSSQEFVLKEAEMSVDREFITRANLPLTFKLTNSVLFPRTKVSCAS